MVGIQCNALCKMLYLGERLICGQLLNVYGVRYVTTVAWFFSSKCSSSFRRTEQRKRNNNFVENSLPMVWRSCCSVHVRGVRHISGVLRHVASVSEQQLCVRACRQATCCRCKYLLCAGLTCLLWHEYSTLQRPTAPSIYAPF